MRQKRTFINNNFVFLIVICFVQLDGYNTTIALDDLFGQAERNEFTFLVLSQVRFLRNSSDIGIPSAEHDEDFFCSTSKCCSGAILRNQPSKFSLPPLQYRRHQARQLVHTAQGVETCKSTFRVCFPWRPEEGNSWKNRILVQP